MGEKLLSQRNLEGLLVRQADRLRPCQQLK
jgi:hypothetical protein